jgi:hypothetical protein
MAVLIHEIWWRISVEKMRGCYKIERKDPNKYIYDCIRRLFLEKTRAGIRKRTC